MTASSEAGGGDRREARPSTHEKTRWAFLYGLAVVYAVAFVSFGAQVQGLVGTDGILPISDFLRQAKASLGGWAYWHLPTLAWIDASDGSLLLICYGGAVLSVLVFFRVFPAIALALQWVCYLSLLHAGQNFMWFQWDILLCEVGFLAIFYAPWQLNALSRGAAPPSKLILWLLRLLLFRFMFSSGLVKLTSGDSTWWDLTALTYHYYTQPLPTVLGWYVHHLPVWIHKVSTAIMFVIELAIPWLIWVGRRSRIVVFWAFAALMAIVFLTGNYNFFNILTVVLAITLLDDAALEGFVPRRWRRRAKTTVVGPAGAPGVRLPAAQKWLTRVVGAVVLFLTLLQLIVLGAGRKTPREVWSILGKVSPLHLVNGYGLFRVMTKQRPEIVIEGTRDGRTWKAYGFPAKPGDLGRAPVWVAPHQPRVDWQMWFAALGSYRSSRNQWVLRLMRRLTEGSPAVLGLLEHDPFPAHPPVAVRAVRYFYTFSTPKEKAKTGRWWQRRLHGLYAPVVRARLESRSTR